MRGGAIGDFSPPPPAQVTTMTSRGDQSIPKADRADKKKAPKVNVKGTVREK